MRIGLKVAILKSGKSQRQIGAAVEIPENRFSQIVCGWRSPTEGEQVRIATALGCDVAELFPAASDARVSVKASGARASRLPSSAGPVG